MSAQRAPKAGNAANRTLPDVARFDDLHIHNVKGSAATRRWRDVLYDSSDTHNLENSVRTGGSCIVICGARVPINLTALKQLRYVSLGRNDFFPQR